jgi:hypothetical protein
MQKIKKMKKGSRESETESSSIVDCKIKKIKTDSYYKLEVANKIGEIPWDYFNIQSYIDSIVYPNHEFIYLLGASGEGKSVFAAQFLVTLLEKNYLKNYKTNLYVFSLSRDAINKSLKCADVLKNMYPSLISKWNDHSCPITISYTNKIENLIDDFNKMMRSGSNAEDIHSIFYLDDCVTVLSSTTREIKDFFDNLASQGRQYKIFTMVSSQTTMRINKLLISQIGTAVIVGPINCREWEILMNNSSFNSLNSMTKKQQREFFKIYFSEIGTKGSNNILVFQKKFQDMVYLQKCSKEFVGYMN